VATPTPTPVPTPAPTPVMYSCIFYPHASSGTCVVDINGPLSPGDCIATCESQSPINVTTPAGSYPCR
jgi:hypothetical protein